VKIAEAGIDRTSIPGSMVYLSAQNHADDVFRMERL
jgi:hypothetical protein